MAKVRAKPAEDDAENVAIDEAGEEGQFRTGEVSEEDFIASLAKRAGHTPKEEWKRDPDKWVDAKTYLERLPDELDTLKERNRRTAQAAADAIEEDRRRARAEADRELREAIAAQDEARIIAASDKKASVSGPPPQTVAWMGRNPWFNEDPDAQLLAVAEINRLAASGASIEDQLKGATERVQRIFPKYGEEREEGEVRFSESRRAAAIPPQVQGGSRGVQQPNKERGFNDIPAADRALYDKHFRKRFEGYNMTPQEAQAKYAASYWREQRG